MGLITFSGDALPLYMLARGKTEMCEGQFIEKDDSTVSHSGNGCATLKVMGEYFVFLREIVQKTYIIPKKQRMFLVLDGNSSHRNGEIIKLAYAQNIDLLFISPGMTRGLQPLDAAVFGQFKSAGSCR
jgi:hypothetical protein